MAATIQPPPAPSIPTKHFAHIQSCPQCGTDVSFDPREVEDAKRRIIELEAQMERLKEKATAAGMYIQGFNTEMALPCIREMACANTVKWTNAPTTKTRFAAYE